MKGIKRSLRDLVTYIIGAIKKDRRSKVLFYHDIHGENCYTDMSTHMSLFVEHVNTIRKSSFEIVSHITEDCGQVMICFDDGFRGIWDNRDFFVANKIYPTIFIAVDLIGAPNYLSIDEILQLKELGFMFESHGWSHFNMAKFSEADLQRELKDSKQWLERTFGINISAICYPQGYYSDRVLQLSREYGYRSLYISEPHPYRFNNDGIIPRYLVQDTNTTVLRSVLYGGMDIWQPHYHKLHKL